MSDSPADPILVERAGAVATLTLNAPPKNPISMAMIDRLEALLPELAADKGVRAVIITGAGGDSFSVGGNIKEFAQGVSKMTLKGFLQQRLDVICAIENLPKPVVCAIGGICVGGGLELALGCHFRIAARTARLGLPEIELGIVPAWGGTQRLARAVGRARALEIRLLARHVPAERALAMGLVHEVCEGEKLMERAGALAAELAEKPPLAVAGILRAVIQGQGRSLEEGLSLEFEAISKTSGSPDNMEGIAAFFQKRKPRFHGE